MPDQLTDVDVSQKGSNQIYFDCEPEATYLAIQIQNGIDVQANKNQLTQVILPFISKVVRNNIASIYNKSDADDVVQEFIYKHILDDDVIRKAKMHLYRYNRSFSVPFCGYLKTILRNFCAKWERDYGEENHRGLSLDDIEDAAKGAGFSHGEIEYSKKNSEQEEFLRDLKEFIRLLSANYLRFFNAVNSLDKDKTYGMPFRDGERIVNEQKLLAYYIRFINSEFLLSPKSRSYSVDRLRAFPYIQVNHSNDDYLKSVLGVTMDFMNLLEERIISRNLTYVIFLPPDKDIRTTVDEWLRAPRMTERIGKEYARLKADNVILRKEYFYGIG